MSIEERMHGTAEEASDPFQVLVDEARRRFNECPDRYLDNLKLVKLETAKNILEEARKTKAYINNNPPRNY